MKKDPFGSLAASIAALATALGFLALQLRADGYEPYVDSVATASVVMYVTSALIVLTWVRARRPHSD
ncbi:SCO3870 family protein [Streptomyces sp. MUSC 14]|uniref:SCO3870 family protein n=1 Tax=Streptomyces sp. MUSC 14 TaxID=1354889 RepID=UPI00210B245D|nr:SCO3870 family protein [Streptomyces sp. MUSC 14]